MSTSSLTPHDRRRVAVVACIDTRTVERWLRGEPIRSTVAARIALALNELRLDVNPTMPSTPGARFVELDLEVITADVDQ